MRSLLLRFSVWLAEFYLAWARGGKVATTVNLGVDAFPLATGIVTVAGEIIKFTTEEFEWFNSPETREARKNVLNAKELDKINADIANAHKSNDLSEINKDAS